MPATVATIRPATSTLLMIQRCVRPTVEEEISPTAIRAVGIGDGEVDDRHEKRDHEHAEPQELQPHLLAEMQVIADQIDAHVGVVNGAEAEHEREQHRMEVPLQLLQHRRFERTSELADEPDLQAVHLAVGALPHDLASDDVDYGDQYEGHDGPRPQAADDVDEAAQTVAYPERERLAATANDSLPGSFCIGGFLSSTVRAPHQPQRHLGPDHDDDEAGQLQQHEGYDALVDALDFDLLRRDALEIEQREAEGRRQERGL